MSKEWDFGFSMPTIKIENGVLYWKQGFEKGSFPVSSLNGIEYKTSLLGASIKIFASGASTRNFIVHKSSKTQKMVDDINEYLQELKNQKGNYQELNQVSFSVADELNKLKKLLEDGILTQEEFDQQKQKLLL